MATIVDVAKRAGVSTATVSRVVSGATTPVTRQTRQRVLRAIQSLGYVPNSAAQNLRARRSRKLLVTVPDIAGAAFAPILQGIEEAARAEGYTVLLGDTQRNAAFEEPYSRIIKRREADGLIFISHRLPKETASLLRSSAPHCAPLVNACEFTPNIGVPCVHIDNAAAAREAMDYLYALGHRCVGVVTGPAISPASQDRLRGARDYSAAARDIELLVVEGDWSIESGLGAADKLFEGRARRTAVLCFNDEMAIGVMDAARRRGLRVPDDLSVVGFDDIPIARYLNPPLTAISQPLRAFGEHSVRVLLDILNGRPIKNLSITLPHELKVRSTTAPPPSRGR